MPQLHDLIEAGVSADVLRRWIDDWRRTHPGQDIRPILNEAAEHKDFFNFPATPLFVAIRNPARIANALISVLLEYGADPNKTVAHRDGVNVSPLDYAIEGYLEYPRPADFETIEMLIKKNARYGDGWRKRGFDVGPPGNDYAQAECLEGAAARVLAFAQCVELHVPDIWSNVQSDLGGPLLSTALNGFSMPYAYTDPDEARFAMRAWCGPKGRAGSVSDVVLRLQKSPAALNMTLKSVDPQEHGTCGNNAAYQAFIALNAVPLYEALARGAAELSDLARVAPAGKSLCAAHLISSAVRERIGEFEREMGPVQTPVPLGVHVEYLHRVAAAVAAILPPELRSQLYAVLPDESLVPSGSHVHRACTLPDHESFIYCLAVDCAGVLRGERSDLLINALGSAGGVSTIWQEHLLACVDPKWDSLGVTVPGESRRDMFQAQARLLTPGSEKISDDMTTPIDEELTDAEFNKICKNIKDQCDIVTGQFCNSLTTTIVQNRPSFLGKAGITKKAVASALQGRSMREVGPCLPPGYDPCFPRGVEPRLPPPNSRRTLSR